MYSGLRFFAERLHALLEVVRREQAANGLVLEEHRVGERHAAAEDRGELDLALRERRPAAVARRELLSLRDELRGGHDVIDDAELLGLPRLHRRALHHQIEGLLLADEPRKTLRAAGPRQHSECHFGQADVVRAFGRDAHVAAERDLEATAEAMAVDRGDDRLRRALELRHDLVRVDDERELELRVGAREHLHICAG